MALKTLTKIRLTDHTKLSVEEQDGIIRLLLSSLIKDDNTLVIQFCDEPLEIVIFKNKIEIYEIEIYDRDLRENLLACIGLFEENRKVYFERLVQNDRFLEEGLLNFSNGEPVTVFLKNLVNSPFINITIISELIKFLEGVEENGQTIN